MRIISDQNEHKNANNQVLRKFQIPRYFCSKKIARATDTHITPSRPQVSSGWIKVRPSRFSINDICFLLCEWESRRRRIPAACKYIIPEAPGTVNARNLKILCRNSYKDSSSSKETRSTC